VTPPKPITFGEHLAFFRKGFAVPVDYFATEAQMDKDRVKAIEAGAEPTHNEVTDIIRTVFGLAQDFIFDRMAEAPTTRTQQEAA
jgi:hypothetical protein